MDRTAGRMKSPIVIGRGRHRPGSGRVTVIAVIGSEYGKFTQPILPLTMASSESRADGEKKGDRAAGEID